jgi:uncharacterized protein (TIGR00297 family)
MADVSHYIKNLDYEHCKQLTHIAFGFVLLLFPFVSIYSLLAGSVFVLILLRYIPEESVLYCIVHDNPSYYPNQPKKPKIRSSYNLVVSITILLLIGAILDITSFSYPLYVISGAFAISTFGVSTANYVNRKIAYKNYTLTLTSIIVLLGVGIITSFLSSSWIIFWQNTAITYGMVFFVSVIGAITGALFESIPSNIDTNFIVPLGCGMVMWMFAAFGYFVPPLQMSFAFAFSLLLGILAYKAGIADISALLSAALLGVLIIGFGDFFWFILLLMFFILGGIFTKYKYKYKESIGIAQSEGGIRSYENVFSNSTAALCLAIAYGIYPEYSSLIIFSYLGSVATATGDTLASEIGTTAKAKPRIITTLKPTNPGTDGAISVLGEIAAVLGSICIGLLAYLFGMVDNLLLSLVIGTVGGFIGTNIDSLIGATIQEKHFLSNSGVNFVATFAGALVSGILYILMYKLF